MPASDPAPVLRAHDPATGLTGRLDVLPGSDGGVAAFQVDVSNESDRDLQLQYHEDPRVTITLIATDRDGAPLTTAPPLPDTSMGDRVLDRTLSPGTSLHWLITLSDRMPAQVLPPERMPGRLFVTVALDVTAATGDPADQASLTLTMYDTRVEFTRRAADEGPVHGKGG